MKIYGVYILVGENASRKSEVNREVLMTLHKEKGEVGDPNPRTAHHAAALYGGAIREIEVLE